MAQSFYVTGSLSTIQIVPPNQVLNIEYVSCATIPTEISYAYGIPRASWQRGTGPGVGILDSIAVQIEELVTNLDVVGGQASQEQDHNGLLADFVDLIVSLDRSAQGLPPLTETVHIPILSFIVTDTGIGGLVIAPPGGTPNEIVQAAIARLKQLAAA